LQSDVQTSNTIYEEAKRVYERILREKAGKGYQIAQATANGDAAIAKRIKRIALGPSAPVQPEAMTSLASFAELFGKMHLV
jgi:hypothetical protein